MRQKYIMFDHTKIDKNTIAIALELKKQLPPGSVREVSLRNPNPNLVPTGDNKKFLAWICAKYLHLPADAGIPILKQAYKQQYHISNEYKLCRYCGKPVPFTRATKEFCNAKCRKRFERWGPKQTNGVTLRPIITDKEISNFDVSGILSLKQNLSVTKSAKSRKNKNVGLVNNNEI